MPRERPRVSRNRRGQFELDIPPHERDVLRSLPGQLRELLNDAQDEHALKRLFPPAHMSDDELNEQYRELVHDELVRERLWAAGVMEASIDAKRLDEEQMRAWLSALNDLRLVLGTRLDIEEDTDFDAIDPDDPQAPVYALYAYLTFLQSQVIDALSEALEAERA